MFMAIAMLALFAQMQCSSDDEEPTPVDCNTVNITLTETLTNPTGCAASDGSISIQASGGTEPYEFSFDDGAFGTTASFSNLAAGTYVISVRDKNGCTQMKEAVLTAPGSTLTLTAAADASGCKTSEGSIEITASGGSSSYEYKLDAGSFGSSNVFTGLSAGAHTVTVKDSEGCVATQSVTLKSGITYQSHIKEIIDANCAVSGCHVTGGSAPMSLETFDVAQDRAGSIKTAVLNNVMPKNGPPLSQDLKNKIACWVDDGAPEN